MDGDPSRRSPPPRDRLPPSPPPPPPPHSYDPSYRASGTSRDDNIRKRPQLDPAHRFSRPNLDPPPHSGRMHMNRTDDEPPSAQFGVRDGQLSRDNYSYPRPVESGSARSGPYPPSEPPRPSRPTRPDDYFADRPPSMSSVQDGAIMGSRLPPQRLARFEEASPSMNSRSSNMAGTRDPYRPPPQRQLSGDLKTRADGYAESAYYTNRYSINRGPDPRPEHPIPRTRSPGPIQTAYPSAIPPQRISNPSPSSHPNDIADTSSLHRDKRARLDLYSERPQPAVEAILRPPPLRTSSPHRSIASTANDWTEHADLKDRRPRGELGEASYYGDGPGRSGRNVDWVESERYQLSRQTSAVSHHTLESGPGPSDASSSKVKRRKRAVLSCTECKQRKIKCDRNVPNCGSCVRRGVAHLCRWGDERDFLPAAPASNITPSNAALMARIAQLESQIRILQSTSSSSSAVLDAATTERSSAQRAASGKYGASDSSSGQSSPFSGRPSIQNPPSFTSREQNIVDGKLKRDPAIRYDTHAEEEEDSEHSDESTESVARNAGDLLSALARGTSLKDNPRAQPTHRQQASASSRHQAGAPRDNRTGGASQSDSTRGATRDDGSSWADLRRTSLPLDEDLASTTMFNIFAGARRAGISTDALKDGLLEALDLLPSRNKIEALIDHYLREAEPIVQSIHMPSFLRQLGQFWSVLDSIQDASKASSSAPLPDLQFTALILAMCEGACEYMTPAEVLDSEISESRTSINDKLCMLARSCLALLGLGQFVRRPNIWGMQAVIALRHYCYNRDHREEYLVLASMALKAAEFMELHRLGSALKDEERWQEEKRARMQAANDGKDPASSSTHRWKMLTSTQVHDGFETESDGEDLDPDRRERKDMNVMWLPRGVMRRNWGITATKRYKEGSRVSREVGRKVWFAFATLDWLCAAHFDRCYYCKDEMFTTQCPQNIDDADLTDSDSITFDTSKDGDRFHRAKNPFLDKIRTASVPTTNSFISIHIEICHTVRSIADALNHGDKSFETVLAIEARFREILRSLPRFFKLDGESEYDPEIHRFHRERPYLSFQRAVIHEYVHHRLLKLHRLYMSRGYWNAKYIHSTRTCIESARVVIGILRALDNVGCRGQRYWIFKFHIFHAVLALQADLLYLARQPANREILDKRADVVAGLKMLHARTDVEGRNPLLASSLKVIKVLRGEEQARRSKQQEGSEVSVNSDLPGLSSASESVSSHKKFKTREWTGASESTGDLAEHLECRIGETWYTVDEDKLRTQAEAVRNMAEDSRSPVVHSPPRLSLTSRTPSAEDDVSLRTAADAEPRVRVLGKHPALDSDLPDLSQKQALSDTEGRDTELDDYLKLLSSYQNPDEAPDGAHLFDVLDDLVFENDSTNKLTFGKAVSLPLTSELSPHLPLLRGANDPAAAGAGFDAFAS
ncbi:hypothetical protein NDA10_001917 [Ustilago hordei]|nr:hypothetical protein NDA10_001917 [Ustilago hordei]KAJ1583435.1 hypothetical protein NDA15_003552 [Ustilago hordei]KAJ1591635.1 hypothetical protein NDA12_001764 [Ustilago hordei]